MVHRDVEELLRQNRPVGDFCFVRRHGEFFQNDEWLPYCGNFVQVRNGKIIRVTPFAVQAPEGMGFVDTDRVIW